MPPIADGVFEDSTITTVWLNQFFQYLPLLYPINGEIKNGVNMNKQFITPQLNFYILLNEPIIPNRLRPQMSSV